MTLAVLNVVQLTLLAVLILLQAVVMRDRAIAVHVARCAADAATLAAREASKAALTADLAMRRIEALFDQIEKQGGQTLRATVRMEDATAVVATNLAGAHARADAASSDDSLHGAAADAAAKSAPHEE